MNTWLIDPLDPLLFGDGKPFSAIPGSRARSLPLPTPAPLAGALRTRHGSDRQGRFDPALLPEVEALRSHGPIFARLSATGQLQDWLFPAPADALAMPAEKEEGPAAPVSWLRLRPLELPPDVGHDGGGAPVGPQRASPRKPLRDCALLWSWARGLKPWLESDQDLAGRDHEEAGPQPEARTHVGLDRQSGTAEEGALYSTEGRAWVRADGDRLALGVRTDGQPGGGPGPLGGEARLASWRPCEEPWPAAPERVILSAEAGFLRIILATPAFFEAGARPGWLLRSLPKGSELLGQISGRPRTESGWDYARSAPKPTRRLVPAGATFFISLGGTAVQRSQWASDRWLRPISDTPTTRQDGYGLALLGAWSGEPFSL